jgi:serine/threonine protein kinase
LPGYEILEVLGEGGMGIVYKARHLALKRVVAIKMILSGSLAGADILVRFRREAEAVARLQHPNIVQVYETGEYEGLPFFSLEMVDGGSLDRKLAGTPLNPREAAALVETLARAIRAAHERGIIHRDLKPANVLVTADGVAKITDFGLAKHLDADVGQTRSGAIMGTPSYMSPEQASGKSKEIGPATDVYALGAILYECLTGRPPFKAATTMDTLWQVVNDEPVSPRKLQSRTPRDLDAICLKCLQKVPDKRYQTAQALAEDLRRWLEDRPVHARQGNILELAATWIARHALAITLSALLFLFFSQCVLMLFFANAFFHIQEMMPGMPRVIRYGWLPLNFLVAFLFMLVGLATLWGGVKLFGKSLPHWMRSPLTVLLIVGLVCFLFLLTIGSCIALSSHR